MGGDLDDQVVRLVEDLAAWRDRQIFHADLVVDLFQPREIDGDNGRQIGREALDLEGMEPSLEIGLPLHDQLDLTFEFNRHFRLDLLGQVDLIEVHVQEIAVPRAPLNLPNERLPDRLVADLEIEELISPNLLERLDELPAVHRHRHGVNVVAVDDTG